MAAKNAQEFIEELNIELADDEIHDWIYSAWQAATEAAEEKFTSTSSFEMGYKFCEQGLSYNHAEIKFKCVVALLNNRAADTKVEKISSPNTRDEIAGAVARGWCSDKNKNKVMDADLAEAITDSVLRQLKRL